jgi:GAF domain-containing protein/anti-sigma regulatory factor (Ser/Thr protein kinase)
MYPLPALRATRHERTIAAAFYCALLIAVVLSIPLRGTPLGSRPLFLVFYAIVLGTTESLTAIIMYWRARTFGSARLARLAAAYAFSTPLLIGNALLLPGVAGTSAEPQIAPWLWVCWHIGWSLLIVAFARTPERPTSTPGRPALIALAGAVAIIAIAGASPALPALLRPDGTFTPLLVGCYITSALAGLLATLVLARRFRTLTEFELWILAATIAITLDALINVLGAHRFSLGFYVGRALALISGGIVLLGLAVNFVRLVRRADITAAERRATEQLDFFASLGDSLGRTLDRHGALRALSQGLVPKIADWTLINLVNGDGRLILASAFHQNAEKARILAAFIGTSYDLPEPDSVSSRVFHSARAFFGEAVTPAMLRGVTPAFGDALSRIGMRSYIAVPIVANGIVYGTFHALASESEFAYSERDVPFFSEIGRRMGYALQNADMYERESRIARAFQRAALPAVLPRVPGLTFSYLYEPAGHEANVGGDFYDAFRLADGRVVISIGDVAGAGVAAAATMAALRQSIRAIAAVNPNPDILLRAAEGAFSDPRGPLFASAFVAVIDPITFSMRYANAGHPPPLLRAPDGTIESLGAGDMLLGLNFDGVTGPRSVGLARVAAGSLLVLYTDGLSEAHHDALAGEEQLRAAVRNVNPGGDIPGRAAVVIRDAVLGPGATSHDDMALLTVFFAAPLRGISELVSFWDVACDDGAAARRVREALVAALRSAGLHDDDVFAAETIYSELIGNCLRHAAPEVQVVLDLTQDAAVLHVLDRGEGFYLNSKLPADAYAERGRGLYIVSQLAREFSVAPRTGQTGGHARVVLTGRIRSPEAGAE